MNVRNGIESLSQILTSPVAPVAVASRSGSAAPSQTPGADTAQLSAAATEVSQTTSVSDVRLDKVASIQTALQAGTYRVPASAVAQKVIGALLVPEK